MSVPETKLCKYQYLSLFVGFLPVCTKDFSSSALFSLFSHLFIFLLVQLAQKKNNRTFPAGAARASRNGVFCFLKITFLYSESGSALCALLHRVRARLE